jgi:putative ABC transport system ATP-binding protein
MNKVLLDLKEVSKVYADGSINVIALDRASLQIRQGDLLAIMGPSGSGKSTLMNIIGLLDRPSNGNLEIDGNEITLDMSDAKIAKIRSQKIGFVFQTFNLLSKISALDNVLLPTIYSIRKIDYKKRALQLLAQVGLSERVNHKPSELSGGERQRVAIARALMNDPDVILADEPTGNLDSKSGQATINILKQLNRDGKTVIIITHDSKIAKECHKIIHMLDGRITK